MASSRLPNGTSSKPPTVNKNPKSNDKTWRPRRLKKAIRTKMAAKKKKRAAAAARTAQANSNESFHGLPKSVSKSDDGLEAEDQQQNNGDSKHQAMKDIHNTPDYRQVRTNPDVSTSDLVIKTEDVVLIKDEEDGKD
ncbi:hypothetical protein KVT40_003704 [Elsinoe batatas]|uniref:Uncharacterized protein n=1 Tax=Elsinoe batatas TaxID=2601811 RepID=A0A8K0L520_9PEZI|nr:hypothetical protein KVT40_003704 [Elsinoe batatas]